MVSSQRRTQEMAAGAVLDQSQRKMSEQELKAAADGVLSEVRKKQADTKRMVDILRALEKLRKLRKEAAARKGKHGFAFLLFLYPGTPPPPKRLILDTSLFSPTRVT